MSPDVGLAADATLKLRAASSLERERCVDKRDTGPDPRGEIERHPQHLSVPVLPAVGHDPAPTDVKRTLREAQVTASGGLIGKPSRPVHRDIEEEDERDVGGTPDAPG